MDPILLGGFSQLDHILCDRQDLDLVQDCWTCRTSALQSHHFPTIINLETNFEKEVSEKHVHREIPKMEDTETRINFANVFNHVMCSSYEKHNLEAHAKQVSTAFVSASEILPQQSITKKRPWISENTLRLIVERSTARHDNKYIAGKRS